MSSSRKFSFVYHERKLRDDHEIQSLLLDDDDDDGKEEEEPSNDRWMVQKSSKSPLDAAICLTRCDMNSSPSKTKENGKVSPLKIKRKLSYAVNKVEISNKRPDIVSPILIKRIPDDFSTLNISSHTGQNKVHTIDLLTSEDEDERINHDKNHTKKNRKSVAKKDEKKGSRTPQSKKKAKLFSSDDSDFESRTPSKPRKSLQKTKVQRKTRVEPSNKDEEEVIQTPSKKRLSDGKKNDEEVTSDYTPSKRRKQQIVLRTDPDEVPFGMESTLPLSSRVLTTNKENVAFKTPEKSFESKLSRVFSALNKLSVDGPSESPSKLHKNSAVQGMKNVKTTAKNSPSKREALKSAVAISKADTTPVKGITPGKGARVSTSMTPTKGTTPSKSPAKPSQVRAASLSEEEKEPAKPARTPRSKKVLIDSTSEDEYEAATPTRTSRTRKSEISPLKSPKESPARSLRHRDQLKKTERYNPAAPSARNNLTPRRSARISMSPSTPSLRQKVLMANTPRSSLPPLRDELESEDEDEFVTPRKTPKSAKKKLDMTPSTPLSTRKVGHGFLSPVVADREGRAPTTPSSALGIARAQLQVSTLPTSLPCREKEFTDIKSFISRKIQDGTGGCMYISGVPGTGKTATVHTVVKTLQKMAEDDEISNFDFVEVNGLRMTEPRQAYVRIWQILSKNKVTADQALKHLETKFLGKPKRCTVLLVDELDYLCNRRQDVIYNILDWTTKRYSKFIVLTIANTMDLPERTLKGKVTSRMGLTRLVFQPYTYQQLEEIVLNRLDGCKAFHADAVQLVARKVAAVSGDARRALDICRRSTEILELEGRAAVSVLDIQKVLTQIFAGSRVQAIKNCSLMAKLVLRAIRDEVLRTGVEETTVAFIHPQLVSICALEGKRELCVTDILRICTNLADSGLIFAEKESKDINRKISLNISTDDIHYAIDC
ncbi:hypothetical protein GE061_002433 [Apolygus lucorum]|uniref:Origin recognition complex subunit 1 n=1 Tax=Apolygus lucorum TaxID=248454 RepID=A0A6A4J776_APOLU|nr:hypothetical protein GE061_002433 [Apolygus lucorum]